MCFIPANKLTPKCQEHARINEAASMPRRDSKLRCDLAEHQAESPKAMDGQQTVQATVSLWMPPQLIYEIKLSIAPNPRLGQRSFDESP
jgi:hypothetical protein